MYTWINCILLNLLKYKKKNIPSIIALNVEKKIDNEQTKNVQVFLTVLI